jgi:RecB family endonuclease NucS
VRLVIALCTVDYLGRLTAHLPSARRLLLMKADGSVSVHADDRAYKPLNWMSPPCRLSEEHNGPMPVWVVENKAGEQLRITIESIEHDSSHDLGVDPGLVKDGVEAHLQQRLAEHVELLGTGYTLVRREYMTAIGSVDLLCRDEQGRSVACSPRSRSSNRPARWPSIAGSSVASLWITTRCAAWTATSTACSGARRPGEPT